MTTEHGPGLWQALLATATRLPERDAILRGDERLSFAAWVERSLDFADFLLERGAGQGERVLLWLEPSGEMAAALFGVWAAGGVPVLLDPAVRAPQLEHALSTVRPRLVLRSADAPLPGGLGESLAVDVADVPARRGARAVLPAPAPLEAPASIVFTSGSTGRPKGVVQSHANLLRGATTVAEYTGVTADERLLCGVPWAFDYGFVQLQMAALTGATQILAAPPNPQGICSALERHRATIFAAVPSQLSYLLQGISPFRDTDLSSLHTVTSTGGRIPPSVIEEMLSLLPEARWILNYGLTESYRTSYLDPALVRQRPTSIGRPIPGVDVVIVRGDSTLAEPDEIGEIVHRGAGVFMCYWDDDEATARALRPDPIDPNAPPALFTGDLGRCDSEGLLHFEGRNDRQLKVMGVRVSPEEVEDELRRSDLVCDVAVFGRAHDLLGHELWAAVVPAAEGDVRRQLVKLARRLLSPNMTPRRWLMLESLPRTTSGKIDYVTLEGMAVEATS